MVTNPKAAERLRELNRDFDPLVENEPVKAIEEARALRADEILGAPGIDGYRAGILIDAGFLAKDRRAIEEGNLILRRLLGDRDRTAGRVDWLYNLANGIRYLNEDPGDQSSFLNAALARQEARALYARASDQTDYSDIATRAQTNLANTLLESDRWLEAYEHYRIALNTDRANAIAATGAARILRRLATRVDRESGAVIEALAASMIAAAQGVEERTRELGGQLAVAGIQEYLTWTSSEQSPDLKGSNEYETFISRHRLALTAVPEGVGSGGRRIDTVRIRSVVQKVGGGFRVPSVFSMFNVLKAEYLAARYIAFLALHQSIPETGAYSDTLDYALYGTRQSLLTSAQRGSYDVLDKIAVAATHYMSIPEKGSSVSFRTRWMTGKKEGALAWSPAIMAVEMTDNPGVRALTEISLDLESGGFLGKHRNLRHASTHRFVVMRDMGRAEESDEWIDYHHVRNVEASLIETLKMTRAALFYFVDLVEHEEKRRKGRAGAIPRTQILDHDWVRGRDDMDA
jgi:hypothetical protein